MTIKYIDIVTDGSCWNPSFALNFRDSLGIAFCQAPYSISIINWYDVTKELTDITPGDWYLIYDSYRRVPNKLYMLVYFAASPLVMPPAKVVRLYDHVVVGTKHTYCEFRKDHGLRCLNHKKYSRFCGNYPG